MTSNSWIPLDYNAYITDYLINLANSSIDQLYTFLKSLRQPDYFYVSVGAGSKFNEIIGISGGIVLDIHGNVYRPIGTSQGESRKISAGLVHGYLLQLDEPTPGQLRNFLEGSSYSVGISKGIGAQITYASGKKAIEFGVMTKRKEITYNETVWIKQLDSDGFGLIMDLIECME